MDFPWKNSILTSDDQSSFTNWADPKHNDIDGFWFFQFQVANYYSCCDSNACDHRAKLAALSLNCKDLCGLQGWVVSYTLQKDHSVDPILQLSGKKSPWKESPHWGQTGKIKAVWSDTVVPSLEWDGNQIATAIISQWHQTTARYLRSRWYKGEIKILVKTKQLDPHSFTLCLPHSFKK